jgi:hypothetical protein
MKSKINLILLLLVFFVPAAWAQHEHHHEEKKDTVIAEKQSDHSMGDHSDTLGAPMSHAYSLNLSMNRNGSGTGWLTDTSPMYGYMLHSKKWMFMFHGNIFVRYTNQDIEDAGTCGDSKLDAPNWLMAMGQRRVGQKGLFHFSGMFSLDPLFGGEGYPLLFQTGETHNGEPLVDRQHPHNLFSELSIGYTQSFTKDLDAFIYFGLPGEPALGPVAFMHRPSSMNNPDSPLGHHWQDATHITFGVATLGFRYKIFKLDGSLFTGREPGEERYGFDKPRFDSYAYRLTINPTRTISAQVSKAFINSPEAIEPEENVDRTTASVMHALPLSGRNRSLNSTFIWGYNDSGENHKEHSYTLESNLQLDRLAVYGRYEKIEKSADELLLEGFDDHDLFTVNAFTLGVNYTILRKLKTNFAIGAQGSIYSADNRLDPIYGKNPKSFEAYLRISPQLMNMGR